MKFPGIDYEKMKNLRVNPKITSKLAESIKRSTAIVAGETKTFKKNEDKTLYRGPPKSFFRKFKMKRQTNRMHFPSSPKEAHEWKCFLVWLFFLPYSK